MANVLHPADKVGAAPVYSGRMARQAYSPLLAGATAARPLGARSGVRPGTSATTVTATSTTWSVAQHAGVLDLESAAEAGPYRYTIPATVTGSMNAAHASWARIDIISIRLDDPAEADGSSAPDAVVVYTAGTAASTPTAPATPARCMTIAQINVPASGGGSPSVAWVAPRAVAAGGILPLRNAADAAAALALGSPESPQYGDLGGVLVRSDGTSWTSSSSLATGTWNLSGNITVPANSPTLFSAATVVETPTAGKLSNSGGAITVTDAGVYEVDVAIRWPGTSNPQLKRLVTVTANCPSINSAGVLAAGTALSASSVAPTATLDFVQRFRTRRFTLAAGDVLRVFLSQDTAGSLVVGPGLNDAAGFSSLAVYRVA